MRTLSLTLLSLVVVSGAASQEPGRREQYLHELRQFLPACPQWENWLIRTGELPPDFGRLPSNAYLPDPLVFQDGRTVRSPRDWEARRAELRQLFEYYFTGTMPPRPENLRAVVVTRARKPGAEYRRIRLEFGPGHRGHLAAELFVPEGKGPFPVIIGPAWTQDWAKIALRRGYLCVVYAGSDDWDDADALEGLYPDYDFSLITRRAWAAYRVIDYLETLPEADAGRIGMYGHSRDGKQSLIAAAYDERIRAVIPSSSGSFGATPFRFVSEKYFSESIERKTRWDPTWFSPRLRFFVGREHKLPIDQNLLVAMVAPRACLLSSALNDDNDCVFGVEQCYRSARRAYELLGAGSKLGVRWRQQLHGTQPRDIEAYIDWFDMQLGRADGEWSTELLFAFDFDDWRRRTGEDVDLRSYPVHESDAVDEGVSSLADWSTKSGRIREAIEWLLGERPPLMRQIPDPGQESPRLEVRNSGPGWRRDLYDDMAMVGIQGGGHYGWLAPQRDRVTVRQVGFGDGLLGDLYYPRELPPDGRRLPAVIWLHGYSYMTGYQWAYRSELNPVLALVDRGYAVFAFELNGFGSRILEAKDFYRRYPRWSRMGSMVEDTRAAIDLLETVDIVDPERISLLGYSLGATVGLYTAALDERVHGVVSIAGFTPMRSDTPDKGTEGIQRYSHLHGLIPRLGFFVGEEGRVPVDFPEILARIAPRPVLVMAPELDRDATFTDVKGAVAQARRIYSLHGEPDKLVLYAPLDYNRYSGASQDWVLDWMDAVVR